MKSKINALTLVTLIVGICLCCFADEQITELTLYVSASKAVCTDVPVCATIKMPEQFANVPVDRISVELKQLGADKDVTSIPGQIVIGDDNETQLWWIVPQAKARSTTVWIAALKRGQQARGEVFSWNDEPGQYLDLLLGERKITRYMYAYDESTSQSRFETHKPFHHVFDAQGEKLLTNGPDYVHPYVQGGVRYPHHRGMFIGWHLMFKDKEYNFWSMNDGVVQRHQRFIDQVSGPVLAKSGAVIHWNLENGKTIVAEQRHVTAFRLPDPTILLAEFCFQLEPVEDDILLIGDREHGGFHFRAHNDVSTAPKGFEGKAVFLLHEDDIDAHTDMDLPWAAMSYPLNEHWYSVELMNSPENPRPTRFSAYRDYGRFGACIQEKISVGQTLNLRYRVWVVEGKMPERRECSGKYAAFANPPEVKVLSYTGWKK